MYTIGQFSKIGRVSTKMLRHYDKIGLLKPNTINSDNGYRYYDSSQIRDILMICRLKAYRFSLEEIKEVFEKKDVNYLQSTMQKKMKELQQEMKSNQILLSELNKKIKGLERGEDIMVNNRTFEVAVKEMPEFTVLSLRDCISMEHIGSLIGKVFVNIHRNQLKPTGHLMTFYYVEEDFDPAHADVEVCVPIDREFSSEDISSRKVKGGSYAYTTFVGPYSEIGEAYAAMGEWLQKEGYEVTGAPYEKYLTDPASGISPNEYVTEVYFPIKK